MMLCSSTTVPYDGVWLQGWGITVELAAIHVGNPTMWVGLAAVKPELGQGLAASIQALCGHIWIWQGWVVRLVGAFKACAWV